MPQEIIDVEFEETDVTDAPEAEPEIIEAQPVEGKFDEPKITIELEDLDAATAEAGEQYRREKTDGEDRARAEKNAETSFNKDALPMVADVIVGVIDIGLSKLIAHFAKVENSDELMFSERESERLSKPLAAFIQTRAPKAIALSPGWLFVGMLAFLVACKLLAAYGAELNEVLNIDNVFPEIEKKDGKGTSKKRGKYKKGNKNGQNEGTEPTEN